MRASFPLLPYSFPHVLPHFIPRFIPRFIPGFIARLIARLIPRLLPHRDLISTPRTLPKDVVVLRNIMSSTG